MNEKEPKALDVVGSKNNLKAILDMPEFKDSIKSVAGKYMTAEHVMKASLLAISRQPKLLQCTKISFMQSAIKAAELGLDFAGQTGQGYLIPYGKECQFIPGYQGFIEIAYRSEKVNYIDAQLVYEKDKYEYNLGTTPFINHRPTLISDRGKVLFGYAVVRLVGSDMPKIELMSYEDMMKIKARSKARDSGPWVTDEAEMMRKTVLRRAFKYIPKTPEIQTAIMTDNEQFDMDIEELKDDKSNLGVNGLKSRLKTAVEVKSVESKDKTPKKRGRPPIIAEKTPTIAQDGQPNEGGMDDHQEEISPPDEPQASEKPNMAYHCNNPKCLAEFDEPGQTNSGVAVCPECRSLRIEAN